MNVGRLGPVLVSGALLVVAACASSPTIEVEDASAIDDRSEPDAPAPSTAPTSTEPPASTTTPATAPPIERPPSTGVGDELFPELGSSDLDVQSYVVRLDASDPTGELIGQVEISTLVAPDLAAVAVDTDGPVVDRVVVDGVATPFELEPGELVIDTSPEQVADGVVELVIDYRVTPTGGRSAVGLPVGWITTDDGAYVLNEPDGASTWLPSNDHPSDKATWRFEISTRAEHVASANGELLERPDPATSGTWIWSLDEPMPTYLVHLVVGEYTILDGGVVESSDGSRIPLTHLLPAGDEEAFEEAIAGVSDRIAFFEDLFGPYPLERYGLAFVDELSGLAMETQGRSLFGATDFARRGSGFIQELLLAHELAHQWFGNAVSPGEWDDLWLNESLTTYAQWLWLDEIGRQPLDAWADEVLAQRSFGSVDATGAPTVANLFGFERYDGGAVVVHALRQVLGDEPFLELMRRWIAENNGTSRSTDDFIALAELIHGDDLVDFFDTWLFSIELPDEFPA